jgi:hypothetical protein
MKKKIFFLMLWAMHSGLYAQETQLFTKNGIRPMIGFSLPELLHIGARYQMDDLQYGLNIGSFPADKGSIITYSADVIWHMFGEKNALNDKPWYGKIGYSFMREETEFEINTWSYAHMRFGHEFALSNFLALHIDAGLMYELQHDEIEKKPRNSWLNFDFDFPVLPSIGITTAYSF